MRTQIVLVLLTEDCTPRAAVVGWNKLIPGTATAIRNYPTVVEALADGWKLLSPPVAAKPWNEDKPKDHGWDWWLVKDSLVIRERILGDVE